jgi:hypothetical protein
MIIPVVRSSRCQPFGRHSSAIGRHRFDTPPSRGCRSAWRRQHGRVRPRPIASVTRAHLRPVLARTRLDGVQKRRWRDLSERQRRVILVIGGAEGLLKIAALVDLRRRPAEQVNGSKRLWSLAVTLVNSGGAVPLLYFVKGRRRR